jgi:hypothetical protein
MSAMPFAVRKVDMNVEGATRRGWRVAARSSPKSGGAIKWQCDLQFGEPNCVRCELSSVRGNHINFALQLAGIRGERARARGTYCTSPFSHRRLPLKPAESGTSLLGAMP